MTTLQAAISSDIDTLESIYKGQGCSRAGGYTYAELRMGLENFARFLEPYQAPATLFMVGNDFRHAQNHAAIGAMLRAGHEVANHTLSHAQGFRFLSLAEQEAEVAGMEALCMEVTGERPLGFRSPGWNISDDALPMLQRRGYLYDSSVHPTFLMPLFKFMAWSTIRDHGANAHTTLGQLNYMWAPTSPYRTSRQCFAQPGEDGLWEFPITVAPMIRLPFFATFLLSTGLPLFWLTYRALRRLQRPIQFQFHLSDFVDYGHPDLADQTPATGRGLYVPLALRMPLAQKLAIFRQVMDTLAADYRFCTLRQWAEGGMA
jgi:hypothetical protein